MATREREAMLEELFAAGWTTELFAQFWAAPDLNYIPSIITDDVVGYWPGGRTVRVAGMVSNLAAYALFLPIGPSSGYAEAMLPTMLLAGLGTALAYGPLNIAATNGIAPEEQGLAAGLLGTSFQFGGALVLAVVTAVDSATVGPDGSPQALLDGFHAALVVSVIVAGLGVLITLRGERARVPAGAEAGEAAIEAEAA